MSEFFTSPLFTDIVKRFPIFDTIGTAMDEEEIIKTVAMELFIAGDTTSDLSKVIRVKLNLIKIAGRRSWYRML